MTDDTSQTIKELPPIKKSQTDQIQLVLKEYKDKQYVDIRTYFKADLGDYLPTKKGITIPVDDTLAYLEDLTAGLEELYQFLVRQTECVEDDNDDKNKGR